MYLIGTLLFWMFFSISMVLMFIPAILLWIVTAPFDKNRRALHWLSCVWGSMYTWFNPFLNVTVEGLEKLDKKQSYVYCANHSSMMDIVILYRLFRHFKWVAKIELMRVPFIGWNMWLCGYLAIDRKSPKSQIHMMKDAENLLNRGSSIMIFPEGTRSKDGKLGKFRGGAFILSEKTKVPIVPIAISGSGDVFNDGTILYRRVYPITVSVLDPVEHDAAENPKAMGRLVRQKIADHLGIEEDDASLDEKSS